MSVGVHRNVCKVSIVIQLLLLAERYEQLGG